MAQPKKREICYEYYTSRDWVQALGRGRQHLLTPDRHPPRSVLVAAPVRPVWKKYRFPRHHTAIEIPPGTE
jgi:hypothetical protein